jgi:uncharacterized protein (TIGR02145 family)
LQVIPLLSIFALPQGQPKNQVMKKTSLLFIMMMLHGSLLFSQVAINTDGSAPNNAAMLDVKSTTRGFLPPRMTHAELNAIASPVAGLIVYCTDCGLNGTGVVVAFMNGAWNTIAINCTLLASPTAGTHTPSISQIVWNWNAVAGATGYKWGTTNAYASATDMGTAITKTETGLTCNTAYTRYAWAYSACGNSTPVTLTQTTSLNPPATPTAGTHVATATQIIWNWNTVAGATGYKWGTTNVYASATDMGTAITKTETGLTCNASYTRYAWAYSACGNSTPVTLTKTTALNPPAAPAAGTHVAAATQIVWNWNTVAGATGYKWSTANNYAGATEMGTATTKTETGLACNTAYTRYAWAYSACGNSTALTMNQTTSSCPFTCGQPFIDSRDGKSYTTVSIGTQCWFKENLNIGSRINGSGEQANNGIFEKYCYNDQESNCGIYGGLYQWAEMVQYLNGATNTGSWNPVPTGNVPGICPTGWHIPTDAEWTTVTTFLGGESVAGGKMKTTGTTQAGTGSWNAPNTGATNESGFTAVSAGNRYNSIPGGFEGTGYSTDYWSSSQYALEYRAYLRHLTYVDGNCFRSYADKVYGYSVRCLRD